MSEAAPVRPGSEWLRPVDDIGSAGDPLIRIRGFVVLLKNCYATEGDVVQFTVQRVVDPSAIGLVETLNS